MRVGVDQLTPFGADGMLVHAIDTAFVTSEPQRVGVAVSGGGDSMALLHATHRWSRLSGVPIEAVTVNHGLRAEAADEAAMVAKVCADWDVPHATLHWDGAASKGNIAAAGRDARYDLIAGWAKSRGVEGVLLGHTADDIAETFLMRLARKSGVDGLSMMETQFDKHGATWARPFWQQTRADLRDYLTREGLTWVEDPTNEDESHERPKARKVLSALEPLGITQDVLKSVALNMTTGRDALDHYTSQEADRLVRIEGGDVVIKSRQQPPVPQEIERRILVAALRYVGGGGYAPRSDAMIELDVALQQGKPHTLAGCLITTADAEIRITREYNAVKSHEVSQGFVWDNRWHIVGPLTAKATIRALGDAITQIPDWRDTGLSRASLMASPAVFRGEWLISAPIAGLQNGFRARIVADFHSFLLSR